MASIGGDLPENDRKAANEIVKGFGEKVRRYALALQVPAALLKVQQCTFLFVAKDTANLHFVFADAPGGTSINYRDLSANGRLDLQSIVHQVRIEVGEVAWAFSTPLNASAAELDSYIQNIVQQYVNTTLQSQHKPDGKISGEAVSLPEIASGLEKFRADYPIGSKTAFVIMQFGATKPHNALVTCIKETLKNRPFLLIIGMVFFLMTGIYLIQPLQLYIGIYYLFDGDRAATAQLGGIAGTTFALAAIVAIPAVAWLSTRIGKRHTLQAAMENLIKSSQLSWN